MRIKNFFSQEFSEYFVASSSNTKEFLVDIFVATRNPRQILGGSAEIEFRAILAVESELGGVGGGAQKYLKRNVLEDFVKLLVIQSEFKVLIFTTLPYAGEANHLESRLKELELIHANAGYPGNILLIHIPSSPQKSQQGHPTNPRINLHREGFSAYVLSKGMNVLAVQ